MLQHELNGFHGNILMLSNNLAPGVFGADVSMTFSALTATWNFVSGTLGTCTRNDGLRSHLECIGGNAA